ncbi:MAG: matrixin family metalloprotease [Myxococcota bacterium]
MRRLLPLSVLLLGVSLLAVRVAAFTAQGHIWPEAEQNAIRFMVDPLGADDAGPQAAEAVRRAFAAWEAVSCSHLRFEEQTFAPASADERNVIANDGTPRIFWAETSEAWPGDAQTLALTYTYYTLGASRRITDSDIVMNGVSWGWTTVEAEVGQGEPPRVDAETVLFHEVGHFFGLDHSQDPEAAMFPTNNKPLQRGPARDDVEGICALYANGEPLPHDPGSGAGRPVGAACTSHDQCANALCVSDPLLDETYCSKLCSAAGDECPSGFQCTPSGSNNYCLKPEPIDELCDQCNLHEHCASGICVTVPFRNGNAPFCSRPCDPTSTSASQCPDGFQCEITQQQTTQIAVCVPSSGVCEPRGKGGHLESCFGNGTCKPGHGCFEYWPGLNFCYALCDIRAQGLSCGTPRSVCTAVEGVANTAICYEVAFAGEPCAPEQCDSRSICAFDESAGIDSALCYGVCPSGSDSECPANFDCQELGLAAPLCIPFEGFKSVGEACASNAECQSNICRVLGSSRLCTAQCSTTDDQCGAGLVCVPDQGGTQGLCFPRSVANNEEDPARDPVPVSGFCACDRTSQCDDACDCDPECGASCSDAGRPLVGQRTPWRWAILGIALWGGAWLSGRDRRRRAGSAETG